MMTDQQELDMTKAIPTAFDRVRDLAHRGQTIRELMAKEDCDSLVKELLEREQGRNDKMAYEALQDAIREQHNKPWHPPVGRSFLSILRTGPTIAELVGSAPKGVKVTDMELKINNVKVDISNIPGPAFKVKLDKDLEQQGKEAALAANICEDCKDFENCFPHGKKEPQIPEEHKALAVVLQEAVSPILGRPASAQFIVDAIAQMEATFAARDDAPECVTIPPHLMERLEKITNWSGHDTEDLTTFALSYYLHQLGF